MAFYPNLPDKFATKLLAIKMAAEGDEGGVESWLRDSPYGVEEKKLLRGFLGLDQKEGVGVGVGEAVVNPFKAVGISSDLDRFDLLLEEVEVTIGEMRDLERDMRGTDDPSDRIAVMRAKTVLLEKWANLKSSVFSMREMAEFQHVVIDVLDKVLTVDQRNEFMSRIKGLGRVEG